MTQRDITSLRAFQKWFLSPAGPGLTHIPLHCPTCHRDGLTAITLYRRNGYQAELCVIPHEGQYVLDFPEGQHAIMAFLGGSLDCDTSTIPSYPHHLGRHHVPDVFLEESRTSFQQEDLEGPHPIMLEPQEHRSLILAEGEESRIAFSSPRGDGLVLLFSFYEGSDGSCIRHLQSRHEKTP